MSVRSKRLLSKTSVTEMPIATRSRLDSNVPVQERVTQATRVNTRTRSRTQRETQNIFASSTRYQTSDTQQSFPVPNSPPLEVNEASSSSASTRFY